MKRFTFFWGDYGDRENAVEIEFPQYPHEDPLPCPNERQSRTLTRYGSVGSLFRNKVESEILRGPGWTLIEQDTTGADLPAAVCEQRQYSEFEDDIERLTCLSRTL